MNKSLPCLLLFFVLLIIHTGCKKSIGPTPDPQNSIPDFSYLKVSPHFDWQLSHNHHYRLQLSDPGIVNINAENSGISLHRGFYTGAAKDYPICLQIPDCCETVLINGQPYRVPDPGGEHVFQNIISLTGDGAAGFKSLAGLVPGIENVFSTEDVKHIHAVALSEQRIIIVYFENQINGYYGEAKAVIGKVVGDVITFGDPVTIMSSGKKSGAKSPYYPIECKVAKLEEDKAVIAFKGNWEWMMGGMALVAQISDMHITTGDMHSFMMYLGQTAENLNLLPLNDHKFAVVYGDSYFTEGAALIGEISGSDIYFGDPSTFSYSLPGSITAEKINENSFLVGYADGSGGRARTAVIYGDMIDFHEAQTFCNTGISHLASTLAENGKFVFTYRENTSGEGFYSAGIIDNLNLSFGDKTTYRSDPVVFSNILLLNSDDLVLAFEDENTETGYFAEGHLSNNQISFDPENSFDAPVTDQLSLFTLDADKLCLVYADAVNGLNNLTGTAMLLTHENSVVDSDGDGIPDAQDDYPFDPLRAFDNYMPAAGPGSLAFEDQWPTRGDYDFNDMVIDYQFQTVTNSANHVVEIFARFTLRAVGASYKNGFGFTLAEAEPEVAEHIQVTGSLLSENLINLNAAGMESGQQFPTVIVFDNSFRVLPTPGGAGINTVPGNPCAEPVTVEIIMVPDAPLYETDFSLPYFNPFIFVDQERGREIHLPDYPPTDLANLSYFGTFADASDPAQEIYYKTEANLPWAVHIPEAFDYTIEKAQIHQGHLHFIEWAQSPPENPAYIDWYKNLPGYRNEDLIY